MTPFPNAFNEPNPASVNHLGGWRSGPPLNPARMAPAPNTALDPRRSTIGWEWSIRRRRPQQAFLADRTDRFRFGGVAISSPPIVNKLLRLVKVREALSLQTLADN